MSPAIVEANSLVVGVLVPGWWVSTYGEARIQSIGAAAATSENNITRLTTIESTSLPLLDIDMGKPPEPVIYYPPEQLGLPPSREVFPQAMCMGVI